MQRVVDHMRGPGAEAWQGHCYSLDVKQRGVTQVKRDAACVGAVLNRRAALGGVAARVAMVGLVGRIFIPAQCALARESHTSHPCVEGNTL